MIIEQEYNIHHQAIELARVGTSEGTARISRFGPAEHAAPDDVIGGDSLFPWKHQLLPGFSADHRFFLPADICTEP